MKTIAYHAEITGDCPPYKWAVYRTGWKNSVGSALARGEADTFEEACAAANEEARAEEDKRRYQSTVQKVPLFDVPEAPSRSPSDAQMSELEQAFEDVEMQEADQA